MEVIDQQSEEIKPPGRSTFLSILCVLSWVGAALKAAFSAIYYFACKATLDIIAPLESLKNDFNDALSPINGTGLEGVPVVDAFSSYEQGLRAGMNYSIALGVCALVCVFAVVLMWNLRRAGFYLYIFAQLAPAAVYLAYMPAEADLLDKGYAYEGVIPVFFTIIAIIFCGLYSINFKRLK